MTRRLLPAIAVFGFVLTVRALHAQPAGDQLFKNLTWRAIGPAVMGGRLDDLAVDERHPSTIYIGAASGGLWKTTNNGTTWEPVFDHEGVASIGDVAIVQSNPDIVWVGTGEPNNRQSSTFGDGIYKSIDAGKTWKHMGLRDTHHIGRIVIDPADPDVVYVAALGHLWGPNRDRGLFKTSDGGATWTNTNFVDEDTGFADVAMHPANRQILYAAAYQRRRAAWGFSGGGPGSGLYKTADGGKTWKRVTRGLPEGTTGRIGLDVSRSSPNVVYATVENRNGGIFRSDDAGETWQKMSSTNPRPMYYSQIRVDPTNDRRIYVLGSNFLVSTDGGRTFADPKTGRPGANTTMTPTYDVGVHGDHHALWIDPADTKHLMLGGDGGLYFSYDGSISWDKVNNVPLAQFYAVGFDMQTPYRLYGGLQDTHSWGGPSATRHEVGILNSDWVQVDFGDGQYAQVDPADPTTLYIEANDGALMRVHLATGDRKSIRPYAKPGEPAYRFNWTAPLQISPHDAKTLWFGGNRVFKSTDRGETWTASPDLTRAEDRDKLPIMGAMPSPDMLSRNDGVAAWGTITSLAESPVARGVVWAGSDDGNVQVSRDSGATWTNLTDRMAGAPSGSHVSRVEPSHKNAGTAYVSFDRHRHDDFAPYLYVTTDFGQTWKSIAGTLPKVGWINVVKEHPRNPSVLLVGTEIGLFTSLDRGGTWIRFTGNLPTVPVDDLAVHPRENDLIVATHGRALYILDDITPVNGSTPDVLSAPAHLFDVRHTTIFQLWKDESYGAQRQFAGPNPPRGAIISYYLKDAAKADVALTIADARGGLVRALTGGGDAGINRVVWDLRRAAPAGISGARGPFVLPGRYTIKLSAAGRELTRTVDVERDPLLPLTDADRQNRLTYLLNVNDLRAEIQRAGARTNTIVTQMTSLLDQLKQVVDVPASVTTAAGAVAMQARDLQRRLGGQQQAADGEEGGGGGGSSTLRGRASGLFNEIDGSAVQQGTLTAPTAVQHQRLQQLADDVKSATGELDRLIGTAIPALDAEMDKAHISRIVIPRLIW